MYNNTTSTINGTTSITYPDWSKEISIVSGIDYLLIAIATLCHMIGILVQLLTFKFKKLPNQNILLIHLSIVSLFALGTNTAAVYYKASKVFFPKDFVTVFYIAYMAYILNLIILTLDRLSFVMLNIRYTRLVQPAIIIGAIVFLWTSSISYGLVLRFAKFNRNQYFKYAHHGFNGFTCVFAATCYIIIIFKVMVSSRGLRKSQRAPSLKMLKKFLVPFTLVFTFFLFQYLPSILTAHVAFEEKEKYRVFVIGLIGVNILNAISDPLCYIFLQPKIKKKINHLYIKKFSGKSSTIRNVKNTQRQTTRQQVNWITQLSAQLNRPQNRSFWRHIIGTVIRNMNLCNKTARKQFSDLSGETKINGNIFTYEILNNKRIFSIFTVTFSFTDWKPNYLWTLFFFVIQWNLSKAEIIGAILSVRLNKMSAL